MEVWIPGDHGARLYMELWIPWDHGASDLYGAKTYWEIMELEIHIGNVLKIMIFEKNGGFYYCLREMIKTVYV